MKTFRVVVALALFASVLLARAKGYPTHAVVMVVPFSAGGPTDTIARILSARMSSALGQTVVVENTTGAGGSIAVGKVARAAPDGYTLSIGNNGSHVTSGAIYKLTFDLLKDLEPVALVASNPQLIVSKNAAPAKDLKELLAWVKANQEKISIGSAGAGTSSHLSGVQFQSVTGTRLQVVHYRGAAPAMQDLLAGNIDLLFDQAANSLPQIRAGKVRAYAVTSRSRLLAAPDIPTVDEAGLPGFYMDIWHGVWVPAGTPKAVVARLDDAIVQTLADPGVRKRLADLGQEIPPREQQSPAALGSRQKAEVEQWWPVIKAAGIKAD